ncbi:hypothetical protein CHS0354_013747 [Potamilus streckersoni]|uniref:Uncharacterized protein n=1 Tax=Potamilus streckersoni TaxID=2493646 RepID=A0AAE0SGP9_9BIVA|nr:hypothetical protein CHS0354_013747 [Potamilus streckersoni]
MQTSERSKEYKEIKSIKCQIQLRLEKYMKEITREEERKDEMENWDQEQERIRTMTWKTYRETLKGFKRGRIANISNRKTSTRNTC